MSRSFKGSIHPNHTKTYLLIWPCFYLVALIFFRFQISASQISAAIQIQQRWQDFYLCCFLPETMSLLLSIIQASDLHITIILLMFDVLQYVVVLFGSTQVINETMHQRRLQVTYSGEPVTVEINKFQSCKAFKSSPIPAHTSTEHFQSTCGWIGYYKRATTLHAT